MSLLWLVEDIKMAERDIVIALRLGSRDLYIKVGFAKTRTKKILKQ